MVGVIAEKITAAGTEKLDLLARTIQPVTFPVDMFVVTTMNHDMVVTVTL